MVTPLLKAAVLIVDDDDDFAPGLKVHLERHFERVDRARSESGALALLEQRRYDLVIMDAVLHHDVGGLALCRRLKAHERWRDVPIMILSAADVRYGLSLKSYLADRSCLPADDFLDKVASPDEIVERARRIVERPGESGKPPA